MFLAVSLASCPGMSFASVSVGRAKQFFARYISVDFSSKVCSYGMFDAFSLEKEPQRYMRYWAMLKLGGGGTTEYLDVELQPTQEAKMLAKVKAFCVWGVPIISINLSAHSFSKRSNCLGSVSVLYRSDRDFTNFATE